MPTTTPYGEIEVLDLIPADEGALKQIYGRIGNFKTYFATTKAFELLARGQVVKTNWKLYDDKEKGILYQGYDERKEIIPRLLGVLGLKKTFLEFPKENWEFFSIMPSWAQERGYANFHEWFGNQTDCTIMIDEGHIVFDSYVLTKLSMEERLKITSTRHFDRSVWIASQRPSAIHVNYRANVNQFYKCEVVNDGWFGKEFMVTEFQDTNDSDKPDETRDETRDPETGEVTEWKYRFAVSQEKHTARKKFYNRYDSKYLREGMKSSQRNYAKENLMEQGEALRSLLGWKDKSPKPEELKSMETWLQDFGNSKVVTVEQQDDNEKEEEKILPPSL